MKISLRSWFVLGTVMVLMIALALYGVPLLNAADGQRASKGQLTEESLGNLLSAMGLAPKKLEKRYDFHFKSQIGGQEWELSMSAVLSQNGRSIWVMAWLDELPRSAADVSRTALLRLLADNDRLGKGKFFAYVAGNRRFVLQRVIPNERVTTAGFHSALRDLGESVVQTYSHWTVANWKGQIPKPSAAGKTSPKGTAKSPIRRTSGTAKRVSSPSTRQNAKFLPPIHK